MNKWSCLLLVALIVSCGRGKKQMSVTYPQTEQIEASNEYFGHKVFDPYRWLEDDRGAKTKEWVDAQNRVTFGYLEQIPYRAQLQGQLKSIWDYERMSAPFKEGDYLYYFRNDGLQNQSVVYRMKVGGTEEEVFLDPNTFSKDGTTSLSGLYFSKDGSLAAYTISEGGSDWRKVFVIEAVSKKQIGEPLENVKFSGVHWFKNEGFYYSSYEKPHGSELSAKTDHHRVYYHRLRTSQKDDVVVYGNGPGEKHRYVSAQITEDARYLLISAAVSTSGNKLYIRDLGAAGKTFIPIVDNVESDTYLLDNVDDKLFLVTNLNTPNKKVVTVRATNPGPENWQDLIPETNHVLQPSTGGGNIFAKYMVDAVSVVFQYDYEGNKVRQIALPGVGSAGGFGGKREEKIDYYTFTNYNTPTSIFQLDIETGESKQYWTPKIDWSKDEYVSEQVFYASKDGTRVPITITHKKGLKKNGKNPTLLYGYGGFNVSLTPVFSAAIAVWMKQGGVYAVPNIRGGGEYGKNWHKAGTKLNKQNVFDDFIAAAEFLIQEGYTSSDYLAIRGGSNGGLLVGATMTQRPDLMKVALPAVGVLDMLRYHTFTAGAGWAYDYGTSEDNEEMFQYLKGYSPVHNVKDGVSYPATLITTGDHDDRVVPAHSFKFAAELQSKQVGPNPTLIRIETDAGHGAGTPISKTIEQYADIFAFTLWNMGISKLP